MTTDNAAEERIAEAARAAAVGRGTSLPLLLTCRWRIDDQRNARGLLGSIWREPDSAFHDRRPWLLGCLNTDARPVSASRLTGGRLK